MESLTHRVITEITVHIVLIIVGQKLILSGGFSLLLTQTIGNHCLSSQMEGNEGKDEEVDGKQVR